MRKSLFGMASVLVLGVCSLSALGMTEPVPEFGTPSSWAVTRDKPTDEQHLTLTAWFKVTGEAASGRDLDAIISTSARNSNYGLMSIFYNYQNGSNASKNGLGLFGFQTASSASYKELLHRKPLNDGAWHFAAATLSGATYALYLDGELVGTVEGTEGRTAGKSFANGVALGADIGSGKRNFPGYVTEGSLWSAVLSADQVRALYTNGTRLSGQETGLWGYWPLNDEFGTGVRDASGHNHKMAYNNTSLIPITEVETPFTAVGVPVTVKFRSAEGEAYGDDVTIIPNTACATVPADPFKAGAVFAGWSRDDGATVLSVAEVAEVKLAETTTWVAQFTADTRPIYELPVLPESAAHTGAEQKPAIAECEGYTVAWTGDWTHVGEHTVTLTLTDPEGSFWDDGTVEAKTYAMTITQATNAWTVEPAVAAQWEVGTTPEVSLGTPAFGEVLMTPSDLAALPTGPATVTFTVVASADYAALVKSVDVFVLPQGLTPTGDPDAVATLYTWTGAENGYWYDPDDWTGNVDPCFGFPANSFATALFKDVTATVEGNTLAYDLAKLQVESSDVTLKGGMYSTATPPVFAGTAPALTLKDGAKLTAANRGWTMVNDTTIRVLDGSELTPSHYQSIQLVKQTGVTLAVTNATLNSGISVRNGATGFAATFHNARINGALELSHNGVPSSDSKQTVTFTGADSELKFINGTGFGNQGLVVRFGPGVNVTLPGQAIGIGKNTRVEFVGGNTVTSAVFNPIYDGATVFYGDGVNVTTSLDFGMNRNATGRTDCRTIISNATYTANNQVYMPHPNKVNGANCGVTFEGDHPRVTSGNTSTYIGKATPAEGEVLPSWRYVLPDAPYAAAPFYAKESRADWLVFYPNAPIELDLTAVKAKGRYQLMTFAKDLSLTDEDLEMLTDAMSAWTIGCRGTKRDAKARVTLGWDAGTRTIYADIVKATGLTLLVR